MESAAVTPEEFVKAAHDFIKISDDICDEWKLVENVDIHKTYIKKTAYKYIPQNLGQLKAEYVIFFNLSYGVPAFSFNIWKSSGVLLSLEEIRNISFVRASPKDFYSMITQQEHPILSTPYFVVHPCHTASLLAMLKESSKNIITTFLSIITPLVPLNLPIEYGRPFTYIHLADIQIHVNNKILPVIKHC